MTIASPHLPIFRPAAPYHMVWLATNACNARCVHCSSDSLKCHPEELTTDEARHMLEEMREFGVVDLAISGGEPLVRADIISIVDFAATLGLRVGLGSNGSTITEDTAQRLVDAGLHRLQVSIDGLSATHDRARRWIGLFDRAMRAIEIARAAGLRVHVCFTAHRMNHLELASIVDACVSWGIQRFNLSRLVPTGRGSPELDLTPLEWRDVVLQLESLRQKYADRMEFSTHLAQLALLNTESVCAPAFVGCQAGLGQGCIGTQGEVMPCVMLPVVAGNIRQKPLREIWERSDLLVALRDRTRLGGYCHDCELRERCGGCRGVAYAYTGDPLAADPRCWKGLS
jgi:AdoMet-dependent heme synthase